eukprot:3060399-Amphidinium_carterae.1
MISRFVYNAVWLKCNAHDLIRILFSVLTHFEGLYPYKRNYALQGHNPLKSSYSLKGFNPSLLRSGRCGTGQSEKEI